MNVSAKEFNKSAYTLFENKWCLLQSDKKISVKFIMFAKKFSEMFNVNIDNYGVVLANLSIIDTNNVDITYKYLNAYNNKKLIIDKCKNNDMLNVIYYLRHNKKISDLPFNKTNLVTPVEYTDLKFAGVTKSDNSIYSEI